MHVFLTTLLLATASAAPEPAPAPAETVQQADAGSAADGDRLRLLGVQLSGGFPEGFGLSAVVRPLPWLRGTVGLAHNVLGLGVQGSVTAIPFQWAVAPTFTVEAGRFFETDVRDEFSGTFPSAFDPALRKFGYTFYAAQLGVEMGSKNRALFFLRGGLAWVRSGLADVNGAQEGNTTVDVSNPRVKAAVPTLNLGAILYVW